MTFLIYVSWYLNLMATIQSGQSETMSRGTTVHQMQRECINMVCSVNQNVSIKYHVTWHVKTHLTISIRLFSQTNKKQYQYNYVGLLMYEIFFFIKSEFPVLTVCGISHDFSIRYAQDRCQLKTLHSHPLRVDLDYSSTHLHSTSKDLRCEPS